MPAGWARKLADSVYQRRGRRLNIDLATVQARGIDQQNHQGEALPRFQARGYQRRQHLRLMAILWLWWVVVQRLVGGEVALSTS